MNKAVFLDRDGVIIREEGHYNYLSDHLIIVEGIVEALQYLQKKGYLLIIITNQAGISKGLYTHQDVKAMHKSIKDFFFSYGISLTDILYCPHHESKSRCICRKPDSLLLEKAISKYKINKERSYFIGDSDRDILAGEKAEIKTLKIESNSDLTQHLHLFQ